jgi:hypothetical protein
MSCEWNRRNSLLLRHYSNHQRKSWERGENSAEKREREQREVEGDRENEERGRSRVGEMEEHFSLLWEGAHTMA